MKSLVAVAVAVAGTLAFGACASGITAWDLRATTASCCGGEPAAGYVGGWYVRRQANASGPGTEAIFYCDGLGKCRQATSVAPFVSVRLAGPAQGPHVWIVATMTDHSPEAVFLCDATGTPPTCDRQEEVSPTGAPVVPPPPEKPAGYHDWNAPPT